ncbi:MAG: hypothetical protein ACPGGM_05035 [Porticoccaceae bacterium]
MNITGKYGRKNNGIVSYPVSQQGNTLVPVIIALAISAIASIAFLKQGSDLTDKSRQLIAKRELAEILDDWNALTSITNIDKDTPTLPSMNGANNIGGTIRFTSGVAKTSSTQTKGFMSGFSDPKPNANLVYGPFPNKSSCESVKMTFSGSMAGVYESSCKEVDIRASSSDPHNLLIYLN